MKLFNAGKEIEAMKHLMLHRIASTLHRFRCPALHTSFYTATYSMTVKLF
jgi:hypothetical protein